MNVKYKRLLAGLIDFYIIAFASGINASIFDIKGTKIEMILNIVVFYISFLVLGTFRDIVFNNASLGKRIMRIKIVPLEKESINFAMRIKRAITLVLVPVEIILILNSNKRLGDYWAKTDVENASN